MKGRRDKEGREIEEKIKVRDRKEEEMEVYYAIRDEEKR